MHINLLPYLTPTSLSAVAAAILWAFNHRWGSYKDEIKKELTIQTAAIVKTQVECKDEIVGAIKGLKP